ncbi:MULTISPECIES: Sec-independent protein translocase protein TatB [unclassified Helicobacter]|uniref:Sec-independent protein translocase protein TatB n=1 Tax=unclassified Helicobacter TaxID=2593540 RepID=UPI000CF1423A|nr:MULTISPECIES: Sec-independent protein translocase protein TatB [unclassified Helicobacter]
MFGFSIFEVLIVVVVAIIFLGPDKLPKLIVDVAKFFKVVKKTINEAKETFDKELQISEIKKEALEYKEQFTSTISDTTKDMKLQDINTMFDDYKDVEETKEKIEDAPSPSHQETTQEEEKDMASQPQKKIKKVSPRVGKTTSFKKKGESDV